MLYKYLFYSVSYVIKKYDNLWNVGDIYYVWGGMLSGGIAAVSIIDVINLVGMFMFDELLWLRYEFLTFTPLLIGLFFTIYLGRKKHCDRIYEEVKNMDSKKKRTYKILNIVHIIIVFGLFFNAQNILDWYLTLTR